MDKEKKTRRTNPFQVGGLGLALLLAGYGTMHYLGSSSDTEPERIASRLRQAVEARERSGQLTAAEDKALLTRPSGYYQGQLHWRLGGQLVFYAGLGLVIAAIVIWNRQAQGPDEEAESDPESAETVEDAPWSSV